MKLAFARDISDRVIFMADGTIEEEGTPEQLMERAECPHMVSYKENPLTGKLEAIGVAHDEIVCLW